MQKTLSTISQQYLKMIQKKRIVNSNSIFRPKFPKEDVADMLLITYKKNIEEKKNKFIITPEIENIMKYVAKWLCESEKPGLLLYGNVGSGKTAIAESIKAMIQFFDLKNDVKYLNATDFIRTINLNPAEFDHIAAERQLLIDDMGVEPTTIKNYGSAITPVIDLIYSRYRRRLFTIITSNLGDQDIKDKYGVRIADRFNEMFVKIPFTNKSFRK